MEWKCNQWNGSVINGSIINGSVINRSVIINDVLHAWLHSKTQISTNAVVFWLWFVMLVLTLAKICGINSICVQNLD